MADDIIQEKWVKGVVITEVESDSSAESAGLKTGDVIMEINRKPVSSVKEFNHIVGELGHSEGILLLINREGNTLYMTLSPEG